ncbi:MAG: methyltransferase dimerization domain-containing protein [Candidatus Methanofastidiosa archaeon]|nr:methyltransferase dimerization domain-containing protein [Candidatus Methanofastidiosa archaeon]
MNKDPEELLTIPEPSYDAFFYDTMQRSFDGFRLSYALITAHTLKVFDATRQPITAEALAKTLGTDEDITALFCKTLDYMGLLQFKGDAYVNAPLAEQYFVSDAPYYLDRSMSQTITRLLRWQNLPTILKEGSTPITATDMFTKEWINAIGQNAMATGSIGIVLKAIERQLDMSRLASLLDLGGGHALYAIGFCHAHPHIRGTVFDQPPIIGAAEDNIREYGSNVKTISGDFLVDDIPGTYDAIFSSFNRTALDPALVPKVVKALNSKGYLIIRRHRTGVEDVPPRALEWNFSHRVDFPKGKGMLGGVQYDPDAYVTAVLAEGLQLVSKEIVDAASELLIFRA